MVYSNFVATKERAVSEVSQGSEKVSKKDSKRKKKSKKHRSGSEISKTEGTDPYCFSFYSFICLFK